jgi:hypothetical protein
VACITWVFQEYSIGTEKYHRNFKILGTGQVMIPGSFKYESRDYPFSRDVELFPGKWVQVVSSQLTRSRSSPSDGFLISGVRI